VEEKKELFFDEIEKVLSDWNIHVNKKGRVIYKSYKKYFGTFSN
jgi:hypothetical protein